MDFRLIVATNVNLEKAMSEGRFREDLYYRLNVFSIYVPPLRDRDGDIELLLEHYLDKFKKAFEKDIKHISPETMELLTQYSWPGNVRQLENVIQRAIILSDQKNITPEHIILEEEEDITNFKGMLKDYELQNFDK